MKPPSFGCVIPAYNEAARIGDVLSAVLAHGTIDEVLVVDDASTDGTGEVASAAGARLISMPCNLGKTAALAAGIGALETSHLMLIDADLSGLRSDHLTGLIEPVREGRADVTISLRGNAPWAWRLIGADYISGERVLPRALLLPHLASLPHLPRFGFEVFLNEVTLRAGLRTAIVPWCDVASPSKAAKRGAIRGLRSDFAMLGDIFRTVPPHRVAVQIAALARDGRLRTEMSSMAKLFHGTKQAR